ncbi:MAG TPA: TolC family protein [Kiritimatiellia bacterium]|nr:TolC family protein [Kiritimatiellia bacterium]
MSRSILFVLVVSTALLGDAEAQFPALGLDDAIAAVASRHPALTAADAAFDAARAAQRQAALRPAPEAGVAVGYKDAQPETGYSVDAELLFPLERREKRAARIGVAESGVGVAEAAREQLRRDIDLQVRMLAYAYLSARSEAGAARSVAERTRAMVGLLGQRPAASPALQLEIRVVEGSLVEVDAAAIDADARERRARTSLNLLLGREAGAALVLTGALTPPTNTYAQADLVARMERSPAALKRLAELERARREARAAVLDAKPDMGLGPFLSREEAGETETTIGLAVSLPLTWGKQRRIARDAATAGLARAEAERAAETLAAQDELSQRLACYETARAKLQTVPPDLVNRLRDAAELADRQYRLGSIPVQLFLETQLTFLSVYGARQEALLDALTAAAELEWLTGSTARGEAQP